MSDVADPITQAIHALCFHPAFTPDCGACEVRRQETVAHLVRLIDGVVAALDDGP